MRTLPFVLLVLAWCGAAHAQAIPVRSGEHPDRARLVIEFPAPADWRLERAPGGYALRVRPAVAAYDLSRVFRFIPRSRISDLRRDAAGDLLIDLACPCVAEAFELAGVGLVIDIRDAPDAAQAGTGDAGPFDEGAEITAVLTRAPAPRPEPDVPAVAWRVAAEAPPPAAIRTLPARPAAAMAGDGPAAPGAVPGGPARLPPLAERLRAAAEQARSARLADALAEGLGRAASQGLLRPVEEIPAAPAAPAAAEGGGRAGPDGGNIRIETGMDRALRPGPRGPAPEPGSCLPESYFALPAPAGAPAPAARIALGRSGLLGEFDRAGEAEVRALARSYLAIGFGAEARAVIAAYPLGDAESAVIREIGAVLDALPGRETPLLASQAGCAGPAALWALLARAEDGRTDLPGALIDAEAVVAAFQALPAEVKRLVGARLAEALEEIGAGVAEAAVRNSLGRLAGGAPPALLVGDPAASEASDAELWSLARAQRPESAEAVLVLVERSLAAGAAVPEELAEAASALAFELDGTPLGARLGAAAIEAAVSRGRFFAALEEARRAAETGALAPAEARRLTGAAYRAAAEGAARADFLRLVLAPAAEEEIAALPPEVRLPVALRLGELGFLPEALSALGPDASSRDARVLRARALAAEGEIALAAEAIGPADGAAPDVELARLRALAGDHAGARAAYAAAGAEGAAADAAWRAGQWSLVGAAAPAPRRAAARLVAARPPGISREPTLAELRARVEDARAAREAVRDLLARTDEP